MERSASAQWNGDIKNGQGFISTESSSISQLPYSFKKRFGEERGTNPEELIGAAHAGCFAMAMSAEFSKRNLVPERIDVTARVSLEQEGEGWVIPSIHLSVSAEVPNADWSVIEEIANTAKSNCPVSKLMNANISMELNQPSSEIQAVQ
jgi:osmotically inducible protein OsmC